MTQARWLTEIPVHLATLWVAGFIVFAPLLDGAVTFFPSLLIVTALLFGWSGMAGTWHAQRLAFIGWYGFVAVALLSLVNNQDWGFAGWRLERYWPFLFLPLVVNLLSRLRRRHWQALWLALGAASLILAAVTVYHLVALGQTRMGIPGSLNPNRVSELAFVYSLLLLSGLLLLPMGVGARLAVGVAVLGAFFSGVMGGSRAAFASLIPVAVVFFALWLARERRPRAVLLVVAIVVPMALIVTKTSNFMPRLSGAWDTLMVYTQDPTIESSWSVRLNLWQAAIEIAREHPWIGTGLGDAKHDAQELVDAGVIPLRKSYARFHSTYAGALATTGLLGLGALLAGLFLLPGIHLWRRARQPAADGLARYGAWSGLGVLLFYLPLGLASSWLFNRGMPAFYVTMAVVFALSRGRQNTAD